MISMDNFFASPDLFGDVEKRKINSCGSQMEMKSEI
jgi:hypothetical protein